MNDREVLELAAKAAGISIEWKRCAENIDDYELNGVCGPFANGIGWNPLTDDGDALRLAVKLNMALTFCTNGDMHAEGLGSEYACNNLPDRNAAARSSIVRAAAEIGKAMEE